MGTKKVFAYIIGILISIMFLIFISQAIVFIMNYFGQNLQVDIVFLKVCTFLALVLIGMGVGRHIMTYPHHITIGGVGLPNYLYDPDFGKTIPNNRSKNLKREQNIKTRKRKTR